MCHSKNYRDQRYCSDLPVAIRENRGPKHLHRSERSSPPRFFAQPSDNETRQR